MVTWCGAIQGHRRLDHPGALDLTLDSDDLVALDAVAPLARGYPACVGVQWGDAQPADGLRLRGATPGPALGLPAAPGPPPYAESER